MSFLAARGMQAVSLIAIIGMSANFISEMVQASNTPPNVLIGTLSVVRIVPLYITWSLSSLTGLFLDLYCRPLLSPYHHSLLGQQLAVPNQYRCRQSTAPRRHRRRGDRRQATIVHGLYDHR